MLLKDNPALFAAVRAACYESIANIHYDLSSEFYNKVSEWTEDSLNNLELLIIADNTIREELKVISARFVDEEIPYEIDSENYQMMVINNQLIVERGDSLLNRTIVNYIRQKVTRRICNLIKVEFLNKTDFV